MTPHERVLSAFAHAQPDVTPCDFMTTPEIRQGLYEHFDVRSDEDLVDRLGTDIRYVNPPYTGPALPVFDDGSEANIWGSVRKPMPNEYGEYAEPINTPYAAWETVEEAEQFNWPSPDWYDYGGIPAMCEQYPDHAIATGGFSVQDFINAVSFCRGVEQVLVDIALEDPVYLYIMERRHRFFLEHIERILEAANGRIDMVLCGDDFGSQRGPLISPEQFRKLFAPRKKAFFDMVHSHDAKVSHHCCGSSRALMPDFIEIGMDALQTIQPRAEGMDPYSVKAEFGDRLVLHGAVDVQGWIQQATRAEVRAEVHRLMDEVGKGGGYILAPCHNFQPDTPIENVIAVYEAVAERRDQVEN